MLALRLAEHGRLPDSVLRAGIRRLLRRRLQQSVPRDVAAQAEAARRVVDAMRSGPIALATDAANSQHYEVPSRFFELVMGQHMKYSCCLYEHGGEDLSSAEAAMLERTALRAEIDDGMRILELGCGWGSLTLWMAERFPSSPIVAVSNSQRQKAFIESRAEARGLRNLEVVTADMNDFATDRRFDRVVSVEMFEHMRNWALLMERVAGWLVSGGKLFVHVFCHRSTPYFFEDQGDDDWMARHFFSGGMMPSAQLALHFQRDLLIERHYIVNGRHYARTCEDWLSNLDRNTAGAIAALATGDNPAPAPVQLNRWRLFFLACAELFAFEDGNEWFVSHYRFARP